MSKAIQFELKQPLLNVFVLRYSTITIIVILWGDSYSSLKGLQKQIKFIPKQS